MFCHKCGSQALDEAEFCFMCGTRLIVDNISHQEVKEPASTRISKSEPSAPVISAEFIPKRASAVVAEGISDSYIVKKSESITEEFPVVLTISWRKNLKNSIRKLDVFVDGGDIGELVNGQSRSSKVKPGLHCIMIRPKGKRSAVDCASIWVSIPNRKSAISFICEYSEDSQSITCNDESVVTNASANYSDTVRLCVVCGIPLPYNTNKCHICSAKLVVENTERQNEITTR